MARSKRESLELQLDELAASFGEGLTARLSGKAKDPETDMVIGPLYPEISSLGETIVRRAIAAIEQVEQHRGGNWRRYFKYFKTALEPTFPAARSRIEGHWDMHRKTSPELGPSLIQLRLEMMDKLNRHCDDAPAPTIRNWFERNPASTQIVAAIVGAIGGAIGGYVLAQTHCSIP
jgi:hypothetical protein